MASRQLPGNVWTVLDLTPLFGYFLRLLNTGRIPSYTMEGGDVNGVSMYTYVCCGVLVYLARPLDHETEGIVFSFAFRNSYAWTHVMMTMSYTAPFVIPQLYNTYLPVAARTRSIHHANIHRPEHRNSIHLGGAQRK